MRRYTLLGASRPCRPVRAREARQIARKLGVTYSHELLVGIHVEREHRDVIGCDAVKAARIAVAHLRERPDYYRRLKRYVER